MQGDADDVRIQYEYEMARRIEADAQAELERQEAYAAVGRALASYRWWGWGAWVTRFRMLKTSIRRKLGMKLWPS